MERFTQESTMGDVFMAPEFASISKYLMFSPNPPEIPEGQEGFGRAPLSGLARIGWSPEGIVKGLNFLVEEIEAGRMEQYFVYEEADCADAPMKADVNLIRLLPENPKEEKDGKKVPYILLAAGGAYNSVCTMVEALPTARHMVEMGYQVFLFTYRVGYQGVTPHALDDLAAAIAYIGRHAEQFGIDPERYAVGGYSAGANLISNFGTGNIGWKRFGLPKPICMFPIYTFIDLKAESKRDERGGLVSAMFEGDFTKYLDDYNVVEHIDADYPPCYVVCGKDDATVPPVNSEVMVDLLKKQGTPAVLDEGEHAPHGFGDGTGTDVEGWPEKAIAFLEKLA